jgi:hypothetical protein
MTRQSWPVLIRTTVITGNGCAVAQTIEHLETQDDADECIAAINGRRDPSPYTTTTALRLFTDEEFT